jgi:TonB family protein
MLASNEFQWFAFAAGFAVKSSVLLAIAWLVTAVMRRRSAAARHMVWMAAFGAVLALPLLSIGLPALPTRLPGNSPVSALVFAVTAAGAAQVPTESVPAHAAAVGGKRARPPLNPRLSVLVFWAAGAFAMLAQMLLSCAALVRRRRSGRRFPAAEAEGILVLEGPPGSMPMAFGILRPAIFLPADAAAWNGERRRMVLRHEVAHLRRGDACTHLVARAALSLLWWNPLAWAAWREFLKERERAADDLVLHSGARASDYAGHLLEIARAMQSRRPASWAAVAMARPSQLEGRLLAILDPRVRRGAPGPAATFAAVFAALILAAPIAALKAQDQPPSNPPEVDATIRAAVAQNNYGILDTAAAACKRVRQFDIARKLLESALEIRRQAAGESSPAYAEGLMKLGDLESSRGRPADAAAFYAKAVALGDRAEVNRALIYLGVHAMAKDPSAAGDYFQRALNVAQSGDDRGRALMWMAILHQRQTGASGDAETLFQQSLAAETADSAEAAATQEVYAKFLDAAGRSAEASAMRIQAASTRKALLQVSGGAAPSSGRTVYKMGSGIKPPVSIYRQEPQYTEEARAAKITGGVALYIEIGTNGAVTNVRVLNGLGFGLDEQAVASVSQWKFQPGTKDGIPVTVSAQVEVNFRLL